MKVRTLLFLAIAGVAGGAFWLLTMDDRAGGPQSDGHAPSATAPGTSRDRPDRAGRMPAIAAVPNFAPTGKHAPPAAVAPLKADLADQFGTQAVDRAWAPTMEAIVSEHFDPVILRRLGIDTVRLTAVVCHTSVCRLVMEYPRSLELVMLDKGVPPRTPPIALLEAETGSIASVGVFAPAEDFEESGIAMRRATMLLSFDGDARDLEKHAPWSREQQPRLARELDNLREFSRRHPQTAPR